MMEQSNVECAQDILNEEQDQEKSKKTLCHMCNNYVCTSQMARHRRICPKKESYELQEKLESTEAEKEKLLKENEELKRSQNLIIINNHTGDNLTQTNNVQNNVENKNQTQTNIQKNFYKCHRKDSNGELDGLNMEKLTRFGYENWNYIDKTNKPVEILLDLYGNRDHPENFLITYGEWEKFTILVKFPNEVRSFPINLEALPMLGNCLLDNLENHGVKLPEDPVQRRMVWIQFIQRFGQKFEYGNSFTNWNSTDLGDYYIKMM